MIKSAAIPALGTGTGGLSTIECAKIFSDVIYNKTAELNSLQRMEIVQWKKSDFDTFAEVFNKINN